MGEKFVRKQKYLVLKITDINAFLTVEECDRLRYFCTKIGWARKDIGKKDNKYVVVNQDEPYAEKVWKLIEEAEKFKEVEKPQREYREWKGIP